VSLLRGARGAVTATFFLNGLLFGSWAVRIPAVRDRLDLSAGELGIALGFIALGSLGSMPLAGWCAARVGSRVVTRVAFAAFCVATATVALAPGLVALCALCLALGAGGGALDVAMNAHGVTVERRAGRPILSSFHAAFSLGGLAGAGTGALAAAASLDVRAHLALAAAAALAVGLVWTQRLLPAAADVSAPRTERGPRPRGVVRHLALLGFVAFAGLLCEGAAADWSALYVDRSLEASAAVAALAYAAFSLTMTLGRIYGDRLTARFGAVALVRRGALLGAVGLGAALLTGAPAAALAGFAALGAGLAAVIPTVFRAAGNAEGASTGPALAAVSTTGYLGFLAGPPLIGGLAELTSLPTALGVLPVLCALVALLAGQVALPAHRHGDLDVVELDDSGAAVGLVTDRRADDL
jgi:MFS family permease